MSGFYARLRSVAGNTSAAAAGRIIAGGFAVIATAVLARTLGPGSFGQYSAILAVLYLFNAAADLGLYNYLSKEIAVAENPSTLWGHVLGIRLVSLCVFLGLGSVIALVSLGLSGASVWAVVLAAFVFAIQSVTQLVLAVLQKHLAVHIAAAAEVVARILQVALTFFVAIRVPTIEAFIGVLVLSSLVQLVMTLGVAKQFIALRPKKFSAHWITIIKDAIPIGISLIFTLIYFRLDTVLLAILRTDREVGVYNLSYKVLENLIFFPAMFTGLLMPKIARAAANNMPRDVQKIVTFACTVVVAGALPMVVGGWFLAGPLVALLGGGAFLEAAVPLRILLFATALIFLGTVLGTTTIALGLQKKAMWVYLAAMVFNVAVNLMLIPSFGYYAAAAVTVATEFLVDLGLLFVLLPVVRPNIRVRVLGAIVVATAVMAVPLVLFAAPFFDAVGVLALAPFLVGCPLLFAGVFLALGGITLEDRALLFTHE